MSETILTTPTINKDLDNQNKKEKNKCVSKTETPHLMSVPVSPVLKELFGDEVLYIPYVEFVREYRKTIDNFNE